MRDWFEWNGVKSSEFGIHISEHPPITMPLERVEYVSVSGRSGSLTRKEGEDVYEDLVMTVKCTISNTDRLAEIMRWLKGSGKVVFANRPGGFYYARVSNHIPFDRIMRGLPHCAFVVNFRCKPFWYVANEKVITMTRADTVMNVGSVISEPIITVYGVGDGILRVGSYEVELTELEGSMTIDCELQEAYSGTMSMNGNMIGEFPVLMLGANDISWTGGIESVSIQLNTRYL